MRSKIFPVFFLTFLLPLISVGKPYERGLYTLAGTGPDKWASVWLIERYHHSAPKVRIVGHGEISALDKYQLFDVEGAVFQRTGKSTTYASLLSSISPVQLVATLLGDLIHEIEINAWSGEVSLESRVVEQAFRSMQLRYGREAVTKACYLDFFDNVAVEIEIEGLLRLESPDELIPEAQCLESEDSSTQVSKSVIDSSVPTLPLQDILRLIVNNQSPVYIDTRETWEFEEGHIPGAQNLKLREINEKSAQAFLQDSLVIAYCVKDFRGYEAARKLRSYGVNAAIMTPHGLRGWIEADLPVAGPRGMPAEQAMAELKRVALNSVEAQ